MVASFARKFFGKKRKYPIKRDEFGKSARRRAFEFFDKGLEPRQVVPLVGISVRTARRYYADWKKLPENFREKYEMTRMLFDAFPDSHEEAAEILARKLDRSEEEILEELYKPWAKRKVAAGHWPAEIERHEERKHQARIVAARLILRYLELSGVSPVRIKEELERLLPEEGQQPPG